MRTLRRTALALVALLTVLGTVSCGVGARPTKISAQLSDSVGLYPGNDVAVLGIKVGSVTAVHPAGRYVLVEMAVDPEVKIPADAMAVTLSPSVVTDRRVELTPVYRGGPTMRDGALIPVERTRTPVEIDRVFAAADKLAAELTKDKDTTRALNGALATSADLVRGNGDKFNHALKGVADSVGVLSDNRDQLVNLMRNGEHLTAVAARNDQVIRSVTGNLNQAAALFDQQGPNLVRVLDDLTDVLDRTEHLLKEHRSKFNTSVDNLQVTVGTLANRKRELQESLDVLPLLLQNLSNAIDPKAGGARVHISIFQPILDTELAKGLCARFPLPLFCPTPGGLAGAGMPDLAGLFLGGRSR